MKRLFGLFFSTVLLGTILVPKIYALSNEDLHVFSQNDILYYDPSECNENADAYTNVPLTGDNITWIGDSYSVAARKIIEKEFPSITFGGSVEDPNSYIQSSKFVDSGSTSNPSALDILQKIVKSEQLKPYLVMAVGTNGGWSEDAVNKFKQIMADYPDTKVVFVTAKAKAHLMSDDNGTNKRLKELVETNGNYYLADWAAVYDAKYFQNNSTHPTANGGYEKWVSVIKDALDSSNTVSTLSVAGTGDYAKIMSAKNADKSFFNGSGDVPSARWSDTDKISQKRLLETYGDLAYQLGDAVGAPYVAILVQMRYEDPDSRCGRNNFWGNGCPSGTGVGGASKQGKNLGEGFSLYAETLTNGYHDQALGIADPKTYLEKIGPTWVQGSINGAGYGNIAAMKKSVDALQAFINSSEGQAIVKTFGNYHGSGGGSNPECRCQTKSGSASSSDAWENGWLKEGAIEGMHREDVTAKPLAEAVNPVGSYTTKNGKPNKILLHSTEGTTNGYAAYPASNKYPAHFTIDPKKKEGYQHFSIYQPALAIKNHDQAGPIQIEIVGFSGNNGGDYSLQKFTDEDWDYLVKVLSAISEETGIPLTSSVDWSSAKRLSLKEFLDYEGVLGHMHATDNDHTDPGNIWPKVKAAIDRNGGYDDACDNGGGSGDINATAIELAWDSPHAWNDPNPAYKKALAETGVNKLGDSCSMAGGSCDAFVATVMRYSGADKDFHCCGVSGGAVLKYITSSGKYQEVKNSLDSLEPGDIRIGPHHIELYVEVDGKPKIASASHCERSGDIGGYYDNSFKAYRLKR